jgi:hypothetical protein
MVALALAVEVPELELELLDSRRSLRLGRQGCAT